MADPLYDRDGWWDPACRQFASLRSISAFRIELLQRWVPRLGGTTIIDLGCGGGLLAVPLARLGARVVGVDIARRALRVPRAQAVASLLMVAGDLTVAPLCDASADLVLLADVIEHVPEPRRAVAAAARLLRPGGHLFVNTINRTVRSRLLAIAIGEGLGFVPRGTHRHRNFVTPAELDAIAATAGCTFVCRTGESPALLATLRARAVVLRASRSQAVGYAALYRREDP